MNRYITRVYSNDAMNLTLSNGVQCRGFAVWDDVKHLIEQARAAGEDCLIMKGTQMEGVDSIHWFPAIGQGPPLGFRLDDGGEFYDPWFLFRPIGGILFPVMVSTRYADSVQQSLDGEDTHVPVFGQGADPRHAYLVSLHEFEQIIPFYKGIEKEDSDLRYISYGDGTAHDRILVVAHAS